MQTTSRKTLGRLIAAIGAACFVVALLISSWQPISQFPNNHPIASQKNVDAKMENFSVIDWGSLPCLVGVTVAIRFNITVQNTGIQNQTGLNVQLKILSNDTATPLENCWYSNDNLTINSKQTGSIEIDYFIDFPTAWGMRDSHQNFSATLTSNGTILDERTLF